LHKCNVKPKMFLDASNYVLHVKYLIFNNQYQTSLSSILFANLLFNWPSTSKIDAPPNSLMDSIVSPKGENNRRIRSWGQSLVHNTLG
jgi:hypothetical protein